MSNQNRKYLVVKKSKKLSNHLELVVKENIRLAIKYIRSLDMIFNSLIRYDCILLPDTIFLRPYIANNMYFTTYNSCYVQYVGKTVRKT